MLQSDKEYYRRRAATERERARDAANRDIAVIHEELARSYEGMVQHPEVRPILSVPPWRARERA